MSALQVSEKLAQTIRDEATTHGQTIEDFLEALVLRERTWANRHKIEQEQQWWLSRPLSQRAQYEGEFVAIYNQMLVDHDKDEQALLRRVRERYAKASVLIMPAEGPREITI